jgi:preprotein translocase subunit SecF
LWSDNFLFHCTIHIQLIAAYLTTVGYSLAPVIRTHLRPTQMAEDEEPTDGIADAIDPESKMAESTEKQ